MQPEESFRKTIRSLQRALTLLSGLIGIAALAILWLFTLKLHWINSPPATTKLSLVPAVAQTPALVEPLWYAPAESMMATPKNAELIRYGKELIANTSKYLGPKGTVAPISNGMNCQNCHLDVGTKPWGNNYSDVAATFPKYRERSGTVEGTVKRVNDCFERSQRYRSRQLQPRNEGDCCVHQFSGE